MHLIYQAGLKHTFSIHGHCMFEAGLIDQVHVPDLHCHPVASPEGAIRDSIMVAVLQTEQSRKQTSQHIEAVNLSSFGLSSERFSFFTESRTKTKKTPSKTKTTTATKRRANFTRTSFSSSFNFLFKLLLSFFCTWTMHV